MAVELRDRIVLVGRLLTSLRGQGDAYGRVSAMQAAVLKGLLLQTSLSLEQTTDVVDAIGSVPWQCNQHRDEVLGALTAGPAVAIASRCTTSTTARRPLQDFGTVVNFYTEAQWGILLDDAAVPSHKLRVVIEHAHFLGLRCASETTIQKLTALFLCVSEGPLVARAMAASQKLSMTRHLKQELKKLGDSPPLVYLLALPLLPSELATQHPQVYEAVFKTTAPVAMKLDLNSFTEVLSTVRCRGQKLGSCSVVEGGNFGQVAAGFLQQMQQMQAMQMATYQALTGRAGQSPRMPIIMQSLLPGVAGSQSSSPPLQGELRIQDLRGQLQPAEQQLEEHHQRQQQQQQQQQQQSQQLLQLLSQPHQEQPAEQPQQQQQQQQKQQRQPAQEGPQKQEQQQLQQPHQEQPAEQPPNGKKPRLSVADSISLINSKLDERNSANKAGKASVKAKAKAKATPKATPALGGTWKPHFQVVESRKHVQCRTGLKGPGQYCSISFASAGSKEKAIMKAARWVKELEKKGKPC